MKKSGLLVSASAAGRGSFRRFTGNVGAVCFIVMLVLAVCTPPLQAQGSPHPDRHRMTAWWMWYGTAATRPEVRRELTVMQAAGLGGVLIYPNYPQHVDDPKLGIRNLRFLSPEYLDVYHDAVRQAHRLGMTVFVTGGSGWPFGGPTVSLADAAQRIREVRIPAGAAAPRLAPGEHVIATFQCSANDADCQRMDSTPAATSNQERLQIIAGPTGMQVKRPGWGGEGLVLDHLSATALSHYEATVLDPLTGSTPKENPDAVFADSFEDYGQDWTGDFLEQFQRRRGYDLRPALPALFHDAGTRTADLRFDFWETVGDLFVNGFVAPLQQWAHRHGTATEIQAYGVPAVPQRSYAAIDLIAGEHHDWKEFTAGRWASSAAHFYGHHRVLAEYGTWAGIPNRFTDTLDDLKEIADLQFLTGITELGASTLPYSPPSVGVPGWQDYAGAAFGLNETWWPFLPDLTAYIQRASTVLEAGRPVTDVLLYLPVEDVEAHTAPGILDEMISTRDRLAGAKRGQIKEFGLPGALAQHAPILSAILDHGYNLDGISGDILAGRAQVKGARLQIGEGRYAAVVLPRIEGMRLSALQRIAAFARAGGVVIAVGRLPERAYGGPHPARDSRQLQSLVHDVFGTIAAGERWHDHAIGRGHAIFVAHEGDELTRALATATAPDLQLQQVDPDIGFIHRQTTLHGVVTDAYFIANTSAQEKDLRASFRIAHGVPQIEDLMTGQIRRPADFVRNQGRIIVPLRLAPRSSVVVKFGNVSDSIRPVITNLPYPVREGDRLVAMVKEGGQYFVQQGNSRRNITVPAPPATMPVNGSWTIQFGSPVHLREATTDLPSWTENPATQYYSGSAFYETTVTLPAAYCSPQTGVWLELGDVRNAARIWVNGHRAGDAWQAPFRVEVSRWLRPGRNHVRIQVANLLINTLLGQKPPDYTQLIKAYGDRFPRPEDWKLNPHPLPSGLLGPVRLQPFARVDVSLAAQPSARPR